MITWITEKRRISELIPYSKNPRILTDKQAQDLKKSLQKFNLAEIPAINKDNTIIAGHQRLKILSTLNRSNEEIDVRVPDRLLTEQEVSEYCIRSNKNTGEWDFALLSNFNEDFLKDIGFDSRELDKIFQLEIKPEDDDIPEKPPTIAKLGDLWQLGRHRLLCGDSTNREQVLRLMDGKKTDMVFTDPPYGMRLNADFSDMKGIGRGNKYKNVINDHRDYEPEHIFRDFDYCKEIFLWGADYYAEKLPNRNDGCFLVWDKTECGIRTNSTYEKQFGSNFELCWSKAKHKRQVFPCLWKGIFGLSKEDVKKRLHPTQKPVRLLEMFINQFSKRDDVLIDLFLGSGSILIACEKTNRICYGMEIDEHYCDVIIDRWEKYTNKKAIKLDKLDKIEIEHNEIKSKRIRKKSNGKAS